MSIAPALALALPSRRSSPVAIFAGDVPTLLYSDPAKGGDGSVKINPDKLTAKWQWIAATLRGAFPYTIGNASQPPTFVTANLTIDATDGSQIGDFEVSTILYDSDGRVAIQPTVTTPTISQTLSNIPIPSRLMSGTSQLPGVLPQSIYCLPKSNWSFLVQNLVTGSNRESSGPVLFGRRYQGCSPGYLRKLRHRAEFLRWIHPYWIGPQDPTQPAYTGPEVTLAPGRSITLTFPTKSDADFLMTCMLDDSTSSGGGEPSLYAQVAENVSGRGLVDLPAGTQATGSTALGVSWRDFLAIPSVSVTGFPTNGIIRAFSFAGQMRGYTHLVKKNSQFSIKFTSTESSNTITLRVALFGFAVYGESLATQLTANDFHEQILLGREFVKEWNA